MTGIALSKVGKRLRAYRRDEDGSATIEACLWIPFFVIFFLLILDATFIFLKQADAQRIVQDGNRQFVASGGTMTQAELKTFISSAMAPISPNAQVVPQIDPLTGVLTTVVTYPAEDSDLTGATGMLGGVMMQVQAVNLTEL